MRAFSKVLCGAGFAFLPVLGRRIEGTTQQLLNIMNETRPGGSLVETGSTWESKDTRFCISQEHEFGCDDDSRIVVRTAKYSSAKKLPKTKTPCEPKDAGEAEGCEVDFKTEVASRCDGEQTCTLEKEFHRKCGYTIMRVVFGCEAAKPADDDPVAANLEGEHVVSGDTPMNTQHNPLPEQEVQTTSTTTTSRDQHYPVQPRPEQDDTTTTTTPIRHHPPLQPEADQEDIIKQPLQDQDQEVIKRPAPIKPKGSRGIRVKKGLKDEDKETVIKFDLCYRSSRTSKLWENGIWHIWTGSTERLVSVCGEFEGCFKVKFEEPFFGEEFWYEDPDVPPTEDQLFDGDIEDTGFFNWREYMSTLWGIGIRRNDAWTWGICLPKTKGVRFAVKRWDDLKAIHEAKKANAK